MAGDPAAFGLLRDKLLAGPWGQDLHRALAVVSASAGDGRSHVSASLAVSLSQMGRRTLLIDADTARPSLHLMFSVDNSRGLSDVLSGARPATCIQLLPASPLLSLLPSGRLPARPLKLLRGKALANLVRVATRDFDHVIMDTPAADERPEALAIAVAAGFALVLGRNHTHPLRSVQGLVDSLVKAGVQVTGVVLNDH